MATHLDIVYDNSRRTFLETILYWLEPTVKLENMMKRETAKLLCMLCYTNMPTVLLARELDAINLLTNICGTAEDPDLVRWCIYCLVVMLGEDGTMIPFLRESNFSAILGAIKNDVPAKKVDGIALWGEWPWTRNYGQMLWELLGFDEIVKTTTISKNPSMRNQMLVAKLRSQKYTSNLRSWTTNNVTESSDGHKRPKARCTIL